MNQRRHQKTRTLPLGQSAASMFFGSIHPQSFLDLAKLDDTRGVRPAYSAMKRVHPMQRFDNNVTYS
jgi:hypothetical protein